MKHGEARFLSCMYVLSLVLLAGFAIHGMLKSVTVSSEVIPPTTIILDAGHGGLDGGAQASDGTQESQINLEITLKTDAVLGLLGEETILTRSMDTDLSDSSAVSISQKKVSDIRNRVALVNQHPDAVFLSIHQNTFPQREYSGAQVFYNSLGNSEQLAEAIQSNLESKLDPDNTRQAKRISKDVYLMNHIKVPGVLVECGFLTNQDELEQLKSESYQKKLAIVIAITTENYLSEDHSGV